MNAINVFGGIMSAVNKSLLCNRNSHTTKAMTTTTKREGRK